MDKNQEKVIKMAAEKAGISFEDMCESMGIDPKEAEKKLQWVKNFDKIAKR